MARQDRLLAALLPEREKVLVHLEAADRVQRQIVTSIEADYETMPYAGMDDRAYPLWQPHRLGDEWIFVLDVDLEDYGYAVDQEYEDDFEEELPKCSSDYTGQLRYELQFIDRFAGRLMFRGMLSGSSFELGLDVKLKLSILGCRGGGRLGFAGETLAEGFAFELEKRYKQAFFCYFSALESLLEVERVKFNASVNATDEVRENERLTDKLSKLTAARMVPLQTSLNRIDFWAWIKTRFGEFECLRNAVAHNRPETVVVRRDAAEMFVLFAIIVPLLESTASDIPSVLSYYGAKPRGAKAQVWDEDED